MTTLDLTFEVKEYDKLENSPRWDELDEVEDNIDRQKVLQHYASRND